ncbi:MAG TPA: glycosyltransferase, partial [Peptostreptococcaceae bacterium]|nr:glycosyltransferase [Peptostreptococcaceae bacterium]
MFKDKNILYIVHNYTSFQKDQIEEASRHFNKVYVLVRYKLVTVIANFLKLKFLQKYREENCIDLHDLPSNVEVSKTPVFYLPFDPFYKALGERHFKKALKVIQKNNLKFDIVHSHFIWSSGYVGMKLSEIFNVPFVVTGHGYDVYLLPFKSSSWKSIFEKILNKADKVLTVSSYNKGFLEKLVEDKSKIAVIYNGISPKLFYPMKKSDARMELKIDSKKRICVSVGNIIKIKGHEDLIRAISLLPKEYNDVSLYIVGSGHLRSELEKLARELNIQDRVFFVGVKPHFEIVKWMNIADLFVLPSLKEGASVVTLEALACGIPVIGTKVGIVPEVIN